VAYDQTAVYITVTARDLEPTLFVVWQQGREGFKNTLLVKLACWLNP
jgi:hypothetical protein